MREQRRFQFSVGNLMLMMVPLAVVFGLASQAGPLAPAVWILGGYVGCWAAVGALVGGLRGMLLGLGWFVVVNIGFAGALELLFMLAIYIDAIAGKVPATPEGWSVGVAVLLLGVGPAIGAMRSGWRGAQAWSVGWSV